MIMSRAIDHIISSWVGEAALGGAHRLASAPVQKKIVETRPAAAPIPRLIETLLIIGISIALLVPCVWQDQIEAGDLASHIYNAWLASQIKSGAAPGLYLAHPWTNVLCDWAFEYLLGQVGEVRAERIVAQAAVLIFFWG